MNQDTLQQNLAAYLAIREALGFKMQVTKILLSEFVEYVITENITGPIRAQIAMDWACANSATRGVAGQAARLSQVRGFLSFLRASFPDTEVPDHSMLATARRPQPYIFSPS